jgi:uncharacterized membrane protein
MAMQQAATGPAILFEALIVPHRSLSSRGVWLLGIALSGLGGLIGLRFWLIGAWPVIAFSVTEIGILLLLLYVNVHRARASERVLLGEQIVRIERMDPSGMCRSAELPSGWLTVVLEEHPGRTSRLLLNTREASEEIGRALGETEKRDLADAMRAALRQARNPSFDNPQLRA